MDATAQEIEAKVERTHWWFRGRRKILADLIAALDPPLPPGARVLDVGCGTGANAPVLGAGGRFAVGLDRSATPLRLADAERGHDVRVRADAGALPFADGAFDLVVALDVLEHLDDDHAAARELLRVLRPGAPLIVFVPALRILWGLQDDVSHHRRRYRRGELVGVIRGAGFRIERTTFFNTLLFPPLLAARLAMRVLPRGDLKSENELNNGFTNAVLGGIFGLEPSILRRVNLPIGVSLACVARRPG